MRLAPLLLLLLFLVRLAAPLSAQASSASSQTPPIERTTIDREAVLTFVDDFFEREMAELGVPGAAFALVLQGDLDTPDNESAGGEILLRGYGSANLDPNHSDNPLPMDPRRTVVRVGSVSKPVTALAALQLVESGQLQLHGDINDILGNGLVPDTFREPVSLFHLLTQTAGFGERLFGQHTTSADDQLPLRVFLERHLTRRVRPPGLVINYNDYQTSLAGLMVETVSDMPFPEAAQQLIFEPLGMASSTFEQVSLPDDLESRLAIAYRSGPVALRRDYVHTTPAAGLFTTAEDMGRFVAALLDDSGDGPISRAGQEMKRTQFRHGVDMAGRGFGLAEGTTNGYRTLYKDGQCSGFTARIVLVPELGVGWFSVQTLSIFGRAGTIGPVNGLHRRLTSELLGEFWPAGSDAAKSPQIARATSSEPSGALAKPSRVAGSYRETMDPTEGWEGLLISNEVTVEEQADGTLRLFSRQPWRRAEAPYPAGTFFHERNDSVELARFITSKETGQTWLTYGGGSWERVPWYRTARFTRLALVVCIGYLALSLIGFLWSRRGSDRSTRSTPGAGALASAAALLVLFAVGLGGAMLTTDVQALYSGVTPLLRAVFLLPPLALAATLLGVAQLGIAWPRKGGTKRSRYAFWLLVAAASLTASVVLALNHGVGWPQ